MNAKLISVGLFLSYLFASASWALDLIMTFDDSVRYVDPQGVDRTYELVEIVEAAKTIWEDLLEDERTLAITYGWSDLREGVLGVQGARILFDTHTITGSTPRSWFFDHTPLNHSEFDFSVGQRLAGDGDTDPSWFTGEVPSQLEIGYVGRPIQDGRGYDLLTVVLHEMGHWLGVDASGDVAINPDFVAGATMGIRGEAGHLPLTGSLMQATLGAARILPSAADVFVAASNRGWTRIDLARKDFFGRDDDQQWLNLGNWGGNQIPGARDAAFVRHGGRVRLGRSVPGVQQVTDLVVSDNSELVVEELGRLRVAVDPLTPGSDGHVRVQNLGNLIIAGGDTRVAGLEAQAMTISSGGALTLSGGAVAVHGDLIVDHCPPGTMCPSSELPASSIRGYGVVTIGNRLISGGQIEGQAHPTDPAQRGLTFLTRQMTGVAWDFSASPSPSGPGAARVIARHGDVQFRGGEAADLAGQMLAESGRSIVFDAATLQTRGEILIRHRMSFAFAPRVDNYGTLELAAGGSLHTQHFVNAAGTIHGDGRLVFSDSFRNSGGIVRAEHEEALVLAATARSVDWDLTGGSTDSSWQASEGGSIRFFATAADNVTMAPFSGTLVVTNGGAIEFAFPAPFELPVSQTGKIDVVGKKSILAAPNATLMLGVEDGAIGGGVSRAHIDQGRLDVGALYIGGNELGGLGDAILALDQATVSTNGTLVIWPTGRVEGSGVIRADVINEGTLRLGNLSGPIRITGTLSQGGGGILAAEIGTVADYDRLAIDGEALLDGCLAVTFRQRPAIGDTFDLLDYRSVTGNFRQLLFRLSRF